MDGTVQLFLLPVFGSPFRHAGRSADGLSVAAGILPALGFALLMQLTYNKELAPYLFIGFVFVAFLGMSNVGVAIVGAILAVLVFNSSNHANKEVAVDDNEI